MEPLVSIITPMYNSENYIAETINSVIEQTYKNWEMIIIDDNSRDCSYNIVNEYAKKDKRIKLYKNSSNEGVVKTRNKGIDIANGKYIAFLDSDDLWKPKKLTSQIEFMEQNKIVLSYTGYEKINEDSSFRGIVKVPEKVNYKELLKSNYMGCLTVVYNQEEIGKRFFKEYRKSEDYILWLSILKEVNFAYGVSENLASYRVMSNSRSSNKIDAVKFQWEAYKNIERLGSIKSVYYLLNYMCLGYRRYKI